MQQKLEDLQREIIEVTEQSQDADRGICGELVGDDGGYPLQSGAP